MKKKAIILTISLLFTACLFGLPYMAAAEEHASQNTSVTNNLDHVEIGNGDTKLIVDAENDKVLIVIDGKVVAVFDSTGLRASGAVTSSAFEPYDIDLNTGGSDEDAQ